MLTIPFFQSFDSLFSRYPLRRLGSTLPTPQGHHLSPPRCEGLELRPRAKRSPHFPLIPVTSGVRRCTSQDQTHRVRVPANLFPALRRGYFGPFSGVLFKCLRESAMDPEPANSTSTDTESTTYL